LLFTKSNEDGEHEGLDIVPGEVVRFKPDRLNINNTNSNYDVAEPSELLPAKQSKTENTSYGVEYDTS